MSHFLRTSMIKNRKGTFCMWRLTNSLAFFGEWLVNKVDYIKIFDKKIPQ